jgi:DnaJ-class molecular chaperone
LINEAYAVLSDKAKKKEYNDFRKYGAAGRGFEFSHFGRNFDPFEAFRTFFQDEFFGFEDEDDIFSQNNIFRRFGGFGGWI